METLHEVPGSLEKYDPRRWGGGTAPRVLISGQ